MIGLQQFSNNLSMVGIADAHMSVSGLANGGGALGSLGTDYSTSDMYYAGLPTPSPVSLGNGSYVELYGANTAVSGSYIFDLSGHHRTEVYAGPARFYVRTAGCKGSGLECGMYGMNYDASDTETAIYLALQQKQDIRDVLGFISNASTATGLFAPAAVLARQGLGLSAGRIMAGESVLNASGSLVGLGFSRYLAGKGVPEAIRSRAGAAAGLIYDTRCSNGINRSNSC